MAVTSLAQQLSRLRVPQTSQLVDKKKKTSFLFQSREAADIDRDTFYSIGIDGLSELISINRNAFEHFANSLFDVSSKNFVRSIENTETNEKLNEEIKSFLINCSPYFLLKPTAQALEWMISRYQVNEYNIDTLLMLALPYYETKLFPRLLQVLRLKTLPSWAWLQPVKREGIPLSKTALFNRASTDMGFFKFVLSMPKTAIQYYLGKPEQLSNLFAFFCTTTIGALNQSVKVTELQVTHLLPAIKSGLQSKVNDFTASVYMIVSFLLSKTRLSEMVVTEFLFRVIKVFSKQRLVNESILLMTLLCQCNAQISHDSLAIACKVEKQLMSALTDTASRGICVFPIIRAIFNCYLALKCKKKTSDIRSECEKLLVKILNDIKFSKEEAEEVFRMFINKCKMRNEKQNTMVEFLVVQLKTLERQYPDAFDSIVSDPKYSNTAKALFSLTPAYMGQMSLFNDLRNPNPAVRANAVKSVQQSFEPRESTWLSEVILERLTDENPLVVTAVLKLDTDFLVKLLSPERFIQHLMEAATKVWQENSSKWRKVAPRLLKQFCNALEQATEFRTERNVLLTFVPYLLSGNFAAAKILQENSLLSDHIPFLKSLKKKLKSMENSDEERIVSSVWEVLQDQSSLPSLDATLQFQNLKVHVEKSLTILMAASAVEAKIDPTKSIRVLDWLWALIKDDKISHSKHHVSKDNIGKIMLVHNLIVKLLERTELEVPHDCQGWYKFDNPSQQFLLDIFKICSQIHKSMRDKYLKEFNHVTKQLFQTRLTKKEYGKLVCSMIMESKDVSEFCLLLLHDQLKNESADNSKSGGLWSVELSPSNLLVPVLLITLSSSTAEIREQAFNMIKQINSHCDGKATPYSRFLKQLESWQEEMTVDCEQLLIALYMLLSPDPCVEVNLQESMRQDMRKVRELLFSMITDPSTPLAVTSSLLSVLSHVSSTQIMAKLLPIGIKIFDKHSANTSEVLNANENAILTCILERIERSIVSVFEAGESWEFVEKCLTMGKNGLDAPPVIFLNKITRELFDELPVTAKTKLINQVVKIITEMEVSEVHSAASAMMKRISIDAATILNIVHAMRDAQVPVTPGQRAKKKWSQTPNYTLLGVDDWKRGVCLLELIQNKKKLTDSYRLIAPLFEILKVCLQFEEQGPVEYTKQLLLSTILLCLRKSADDDKLKLLPPSAVPVESVVDCIRVSQNPQTHHHALSVLSLVAGLKPDQVLHNVMPVFTFMGSSVIRLDDAYSFQVTLKTVETIIPILVQSVETGVANRDQIKEVLQVFAAAVLDIPEHRRLALIHKLLTTLDADGGYLWLFICQVLASSVLEPEPRPPNSAELSQRKMKTLQDLCLEFPPSAILQSMYSIMKHVTSLPHDKENAKKSINERFKEKPVEDSSTPMETCDSNDTDSIMVFDVERNSGKQLRHYKYNLLNFISGLFSAEQFVSMMVIHNNRTTNDDERESLLLCFQQLVEGILGYMKDVSSQVDLTVNQPSAKYWKAMLNLIYDLLSKTNALLPSEMFLEVVGSLLPHKIPKMRRRVMELLNWQLQSSIPLAPEGLRSLLPTLLTIVRDRKAFISQEILLNRQTALISVKLLARKIASVYPDDFQEALELMTKLVQEGVKCESSEEMAVTACAILCVAELLSCLGLKAIAQLPRFMPALIGILAATSATPNVPEFLLTSVITTLLKILEYHSNFISPYLSDILMELALISAKFEKQTDTKSDVINLKMNSVLTNISEKVPMRIIVPAITASYSDLLEKGELTALPVVLSVLSSSSQPQHHLKGNIQSFLLKALAFRDEHPRAAADTQLAVEKATVQCVIAHVLKLNEKEFHGFCREVVTRSTTPLKMISLFKVLQTLSETLKSLFLPFSKEFQAKAIDALNLKKIGDQRRSAELLEATIGYLLNVFRYDNERSVTETHLNALMAPLVNLLENEVCIKHNLFDNLLIPCLANLAKCLSDDSLWKKFNYEILLKTQHENAKVRLGAVKAVCEVAKKLGDSYLPLLPESIPFLAELLEDEEEEVERTCRSVVQDMEAVLGEQISKYFSK
ncbi:HEAT repeat-containing protein 1 [Nilaparvata lugens]|uniref:HEAT repeat-containing protein 1 n=1 Tax=Nilaparvata lugens TaxID=108931 RepID=UPI00193CFAAC|nr:HEAT repeat-containing protein 1 [Nilaparvata lugens]